MKKLTFSELNARLQGIFETEDKFEGFKNLSFDLAHGHEIFDDEGNKVSTVDANAKVRNYVFNILGINEKSTKRDRKRAFKKYGTELFEVIEEVIDIKVEKGFRDSEFFNQFVEERNLKRGDSQEFWTDEEVILSVSRIAGDHHDFTLQRLGKGSSYTVTTSVFGIAVGADIDLYLAGRLDWSKFTDACAKAFVIKVQNEMYAEVMNAGEKLPAQFKGTGALDETVKDEFDMLIEDVSIANGNCPVIILGTKAALKKITKLADIDWVTDEMKSQVANTGRLGYYEGTLLMEIPQRFKLDANFAVKDADKRIVDSTKLFVLPQVEDKFVKFVDVGETEIYELTEIGDRMDDTMKYEVQRAMGIGTQFSRYFGMWQLA